MKFTRTFRSFHANVILLDENGEQKQTKIVLFESNEAKARKAILKEFKNCLILECYPVIEKRSMSVEQFIKNSTVEEIGE